APSGDSPVVWELQGVADPFLLGDGTFGSSDRVELYACPFTEYVFLTAEYYPYKNTSVSPPVTQSTPRGIRLVLSQDKGKSWKFVDSEANLDGVTPMVMTSTPNGRLFLYHWVRQNAAGFAAASYYGELFCSDLFDSKTGKTPKIQRVLPLDSGQ